MVEKILRTTIQMNNLLKVINSNEYLTDINSADQIYDSNVNIVEEILLFNKNRRLENESVDETDEEDNSNSNSNSEEKESLDSSKDIDALLPDNEFDETEDLTKVKV